MAIDVFRPVVFPEKLSRRATRDRGYVTAVAETDFFEQRNAAGDADRSVFNLSHLLKDPEARRDINAFLDNMTGGATAFLFKWWPEHNDPADRTFVTHIKAGDPLAGTNNPIQLRRSRPLALRGAAQAGGAAAITLAAAQDEWLDHDQDDTYNGKYITITGGTGAGQVREITDYVGAARVATVNAAWVVEPTAGSVYEISFYNDQKVITNPDWREPLTIYENDAALAVTMDHRTGKFVRQAGNWSADTILTGSFRFLYKVRLLSTSIRETDRYQNRADVGPLRFQEILPPLGT